LNPFEVGDPFIEWNEEVSAREDNEFEENAMANVPDMHVETLETLKDSVVKLLVSKHDFEVEEAEEYVEDSVTKNPDLWHDDAEAEDLAKYLATEDDDD